MPWTERVSVVIPGQQCERIRELVAAGQAKSMSGYIAAAVARHLAEQDPTTTPDQIDTGGGLRQG